MKKVSGKGRKVRVRFPNTYQPENSSLKAAIHPCPTKHPKHPIRRTHSASSRPSTPNIDILENLNFNDNRQISERVLKKKLTAALPKASANGRVRRLELPKTPKDPSSRPQSTLEPQKISPEPLKREEVARKLDICVQALKFESDVH